MPQADLLIVMGTSLEVYIMIYLKEIIITEQLPQVGYQNTWKTECLSFNLDHIVIHGIESNN